MNKVTKGTLAAAAAGALLLGGVGTYARWSDSASLDAGDVSTGVLDVHTESALGWTYDGITSVDDPATLEVELPDIVPGDIVTAKYNVDVVAEGDNIKGSFRLRGINQTELPDGVTVTIAPDPAATAVAALKVIGADVTFEEAATYDFDVIVTVTFDAETFNQDGQDEYIDFAGAELTLTQS